MGQKVNPIGYRLGVNKQWSSTWYADAKTYPDYLLADIKIREYLKRKLAHAFVGRIQIERPAQSAKVTIFSARPGIVIGKKGQDIESLRADVAKIMGVPVQINIEEIRKPELDAQLVADSIAQQIERRVMYRRAMKRAVTNSMRLGAEGIRINISGRLGGAEIARAEWYREGRVPLHTLRADIDYALSQAFTTYGVIGVKVWIYRGDLQPGEISPYASNAAAPAQAAPGTTA